MGVTASRSPAVIDDRWDQDDALVHDAALAFTLESEDKTLRVRPMQMADVDAASAICNRAFNEFNLSVGLSLEFPPRETIDIPKIYYTKGATPGSGNAGFVAVNDRDEVVGANMLHYPDGVGGIGPICSSAPGAGRLVMKAAMKAAAEMNVRSVRLVQVIPNTRSYSLYLGLGFEPRRVSQEYVGRCSITEPLQGIAVAAITAADVEECSGLHERVCGTKRAADIAAAVGAPVPSAVARDSNGALLGYTTGSDLEGHTVTLSADAFKALIVAQSNAVDSAQQAGVPIPPTSVKVPHQYSSLARWLASNGFQLKRQMTSMSYGPHPEPIGGYYFPSITY